MTVRFKPKIQFLNMANEAIAIIEANLTEPILVTDITKEFEKSHWQFQRMFRSIVGVSLGQYLRERRLAEACQRLRESDDRILDIAIDFDFGSQEAFTRAFKGFFQISPNECRQNKTIILREARNPTTPEKLKYFWENVQRIPTLIQQKEKIVVGSQIEFDSHFIEGSSCEKKIGPHWADFKQRMHLIPHRANNERIAVVLSTELDLREEKLTYLSGVEVLTVGNMPPGMVSLKVPAGLFACFENRSLPVESGSLMDYIYGIWLPSSDYERGLGYDLEVFDHRYDPTLETSMSRFMIPLAPRS